MPEVPRMEWPVRWVREQLGYEVRDLALFSAALTHRSAARPHNERLEFLGDAVLGFLIARRAYENFPEFNEGELTKLRASLVREESLATHMGRSEWNDIVLYYGRYALAGVAVLLVISRRTAFVDVTEACRSHARHSENPFH